MSIVIAAGLLLVAPVLVAALALRPDDVLQRAYPSIHGLLAIVPLVEVARWSTALVFAALAVRGGLKEHFTDAKLSAPEPIAEAMELVVPDTRAARPVP
jgi:hypothetical protein